MGRVYATEFENVAVTAAQDFFEIAPATDKPCRLLSLELSQFSDFADAAEELLRVRVIRGHATSGSVGGTANETPVLPGDGAASYTGEINNTTIASTGTPVNLWSGAFNIRVGLEKLDAQQPVMVRRLVARRNTQPCVIRIEYAGHSYLPEPIDG